MDTFESVILVKNEIFVFKLPPRTSNRAYRAADWNLEEPQWTGRMRLVTKGNELVMKLEDKSTGELFAKCPIEAYPGVAIEAVSDSSRYFVIKIQDDNGRTAYIGLGFGDRSDSFDFNVALQDHFKWLKKTKDEADMPPSQDLDLSFKDGETIKINMKITKKDGADLNKKTSRLAGSSGGLGVLPPPPQGSRLPPPPSPQHSINIPKPPSNNTSPNTEESKAQQDWVKF